MLPTSLQAIGMAASEPDSKAAFLEKAQFALTTIFKHGVKVCISME